MTEATHQILGRCASRCRQCLPSVSQIMEPEARHTSPAPRAVERLAYRIAPHRTTVTPNEHPILSGPCHHMFGQDRQHVGRDRHCSLARVSLRVSIECLRCLQQLDAVLSDSSAWRRLLPGC